MATIAERIKLGLSIRNMKQIDLIEKTKINKGALSSYISGKYEPKQKNIFLIAKALDVNEAWLMGCDVPMERIEQYNDLSTKEKILLSNYNKLNDLGKDEAIKRVSELTEIYKYTKEDTCCTIKEDKSYLEVFAAHDREGEFSEEDIQHDLDIMNDENF